MDLSNFRRDAAAVSGGVWVKDIPQGGEIELCVRGMSSPIVTAARARKERKVPKSGRNRDGSLKVDILQQIMRELLAETVLIDVRGLTQDGAAVDVDRARELILDPDFEPFADCVVWASNAVDRGVAEETEDAEKN